jgi:hypothetical protein
MGWTRLAALSLGVLTACGNDSAPSEPPLFPVDYLATYQEVRNCRFSLEHDLLYVRVLASPEAVTPYTGRMAPFPTGAIVVKEEYGENDTTCAGPITFFTAMEKLDVGSSPATLDWHWQKVDANRRTISSDATSCIHCHSNCAQPPDGYDSTCEMP